MVGLVTAGDEPSEVRLKATALHQGPAQKRQFARVFCVDRSQTQDTCASSAVAMDVLPSLGSALTPVLRLMTLGQFIRRYIVVTEKSMPICVQRCGRCCGICPLSLPMHAQ